MSAFAQDGVSGILVDGFLSDLAIGITTPTEFEDES
jgi:hypothetical protein